MTVTAFDVMFGALFADPNMASAGLYTPPDGGPAVSCRVSFRQPDLTWHGGDASVTSPARIAEIRVSEVPAIEEEGTLAVGGVTYTVQNATRPDSDRLLWRVELR